PLMDDNVKKHNLPLYFACMFFVKVLGPGLGLLIGSKLNEIYYNFNPPQGLTPLDPAWIGCWWLGFLIFGPLKPRKTLNLYDKHVKIHGAHVTAQEKINGMRVYFKSSLLLFDNCSAIRYTLEQCSDGSLTSWLSKAATGMVGFVSGVMAGSVAMRKFRLQGRRAATWVAVCSLVAALMGFANGAVGCKSVIGQIGDQAVSNNLSFPGCREDCVCDGMPFYPVCNSKGDVFYSPCQAGCPLSGANFSIYAKKDKSTSLTFTDCECSGTEDGVVSRSYCPTEHCTGQFHIFLVNKVIGAVFGGLAVVPGMSVPPEHRSISLGFNGLLVSLLATLPSPVFWGKIFDMSCLMWQNVCSKTGACAIYNTDQLRIRLHVIYGSLRLFALIADVWVIYWAKNLKLIDEEDEPTKSSDAVGDVQELGPMTNGSEGAKLQPVVLSDNVRSNNTDVLP
ncbi:Solute carrier organic anion transporter family member 1B3, partial [Trichostrongylus colubriformis]